jgi:hypothetical protein
MFGRRYAIFHNHVHLGELELEPIYRYSAETPTVRTRIKLDSVRLLGVGTIRDFLAGVALHVCDSDSSTREYLQSQMYIDRALTESLWQTGRITEFGMDGEDWGELELQLDGSASWYFDRREAWLRQQSERAETNPQQ